MPTRAEIAEAIILYYIELHYLRVQGLIPKIGYPLMLRGRELGISLRSIWRCVSFGRKVGMIDSEPRFR